MIKDQEIMNKKFIENLIKSVSSAKEARKARDAWAATQDYQRQIYSTPQGLRSNALRDQGHRLKAQGDLEQAHGRFVFALSQHAVGDESAAAAACWYDLGQSFTEIRKGVRAQNLAEAVQLLRRAELSRVRRADVRRHILSLDGLGRALRAVAIEFDNDEALKEALQRLRKAVKLAKEHGVATLDLLINSLSNLGNTLVEANAFDEAVRVHEESVVMAEGIPAVDMLMLEGLRLPLLRLNLVRALHQRGKAADQERAQRLVDTIIASEAPPDIIARTYLIGYDIARSLGAPSDKLMENYLKKVEPICLNESESIKLIKLFKAQGAHEQALALAQQCVSSAILERRDTKASAHADHCAAKAQRFSRIVAELFAEAGCPLSAFVALENTAAMRYFDVVTQNVWSPETPLLHTIALLHNEASGWSVMLDDLALRVAGLDGEVLQGFFDACLQQLRVQPKTSDFEWEGSLERLQEVFSHAKHSNVPYEVLKAHSRVLGEVTHSLWIQIERLDPSRFKVSEQGWSNEVSEEQVRCAFDAEPDVVLLRLSLSEDKLLAISVWKQDDALHSNAKTFGVDAQSVRALSMLAYREKLEGEDAERVQTALNTFLASIDLSLVLPQWTTHVIILPSQRASYVPWAACGPAERILIDVVDVVSYLPNITPLCMRQAPWAPRSGTLLVAPGAAAPHRTCFHGIAFSETTADEVQLFEAAATRTATAEHAASADVVSIFAHGSYNAQNPLGVIQLVDGLFTPKEYFSIWRGMERVEIWACRTGVNVSYDPLTPWVDEGFGLDVDLHHLGVRSTIGTLWEVPDFVTAMLVREYRRALARGRRAPAALADAQRWWRAEGLKQVRTALKSDEPRRNLRERFASLSGEAISIDDLVGGSLGPVAKDSRLSTEEIDAQLRFWSAPSAWAGFRFLGVCERRPHGELPPRRELTSEERIQVAQILKRTRTTDDDESFEAMLSAATLEYVRTSPTTSQAIHAARLYATRRRGERAHNLVRGLAWIHEALAAPLIDDTARVTLLQEVAWLWFELALGEVPLSIRSLRPSAKHLYERAAAAIEALPPGAERALLEYGLTSAQRGEYPDASTLYTIWEQIRSDRSGSPQSLRQRCLLVSLLLAQASCAPKQLAEELVAEFSAIGLCDEVELRWRARYGVLLGKLLWRSGLEQLPIPSLPPTTLLPHALFLDRCEVAGQALATWDEVPEDLMLELLSNDLSLLEADLWGYRRDNGVPAWMATGSPGAGWQRFVGMMFSQVLAREPAQGREVMHFIASIHLGADLRMAPLIASSLMQGILHPDERQVGISTMARGREKLLSLLCDAAALNEPESDVFSQGSLQLQAAITLGSVHFTGWLVDVALDRYQWGGAQGPKRSRTAAFDLERHLLLFDQSIAQSAMRLADIEEEVASKPLPPWLKTLTKLAGGPPRDLEALERKLAMLPPDVAVLGAFEGAQGELLLGVVWAQNGQNRQAIQVVGEFAGLKTAHLLWDVQRLRPEDLEGELRGVSEERAQAWEALRCLLDEPLGALLRDVDRRALRVLAPHALRSLPWLGLTANGEPLYAREAGVALLPFLGFEDLEAIHTRYQSQSQHTACILGGTLEHGETRFGEVIIGSLRRLLPYTQPLEPRVSPGTTIVEMDFIEENEPDIHVLRFYGTGSPATLNPSTEGLTLSYDRTLLARNFDDINLSACECVELWAATEGPGATSRQTAHHDALPSLVRTFIVDGAGGVLDLAWPVHDLVKALVCERFGLLRHGSRGPALALALAVSGTAKLLADWSAAAVSFEDGNAALAWLDTRRQEQARSFGLRADAILPLTSRATLVGADPRAFVELCCQPIHLAAFRWWGA
jgi:hypothetical protein